MNSRSLEDSFFQWLSEGSEAVESSSATAPSRLKAKVYSALLRRQTESGPLLSLSETEANGRPLCLFEKLVQISPAGESLKSRNFCQICHARLVAEKIENAPIYWPHCPYVEFQNR